MKKRDWLIIILPLFATWLVDRISKSWATHLHGFVGFGPFTFNLNYNHGAMLGLFSDLPAILRIVSLSTSGAFLLCTYVLIQYLLPIKSLTLRTGLSILVGGVIGNVTDRIIWGYVVDFIILGNPPWARVAFNLADALQWLGYILIFYAIIREGEKIWPEKDIRRQYWVNRPFQLRYCFILMGVGISLTVIGLVFSYTYLNVTIQETVGNNPEVLNKFLKPFVITYIIISVAFCAILFSVGRLISHRIAGPLYAFERFLQSCLGDGPVAPLKLRNGDDFKHLENLATEVSIRIQSIKKERTVNVVEYSPPTEEAAKKEEPK